MVSLPAVIDGCPFFSLAFNCALAKELAKSLNSFLVKLFLASSRVRGFVLFSKKLCLALSDILVLKAIISLGVTVVAIGSSNDCPISKAVALFISVSYTHLRAHET